MSNKFQSLTGAIQTFLAGRILFFFLSFQSLTGAIQTSLHLYNNDKLI